MRKGLKREGSPPHEGAGPLRVLFICSRNRRRSPTAEHVFGKADNLAVASAGLAPDAEEVVTGELLEWAEVVIVMEFVHRRKLQRAFGNALRHVRIHCLGIPDDYAFMDPVLIERLRREVPPLLHRR